MARTDADATRAVDGGGPPPWSAEPPTHAVAAAIAARAGIDATELAPLHGSVDTEALDDLLASAVDARVSFTHLGYEITVTGAGEVTVVDPTG